MLMQHFNVDYKNGIFFRIIIIIWNVESKTHAIQARQYETEIVEKAFVCFVRFLC